MAYPNILNSHCLILVTCNIVIYYIELTGNLIIDGQGNGRGGILTCLDYNCSPLAAGLL